MKLKFKILAVSLMSAFAIPQVHAQESFVNKVECIINAADQIEHSYNKNSYSQQVSELTIVYSIQSSLLVKVRMKNRTTRLAKIETATSKTENIMIQANVVPSFGGGGGRSVWDDLKDATELSIRSQVQVIGFCQNVN